MKAVWSINGPHLVCSERHCVWACCLLVFLGLFSFNGCRKATPARVPQTPSSGNDRRLVLESLAHGELDIEILDTCSKGAVRDELKSYCQEAVSKQRRESDVLRAWLGDWYGAHVEDLPQLNQIKEERRLLLRGLEPKRDLPYEFRLLMNIVSYASEAMTDMRACAAEAYRKELKEFCQMTEEARRTSGRIPEAWVCRWYRDCISKAFPPYPK
ncbi:MAG: hypothetical protein LC114_04930 [Bryobacterales bacterium]|nr:hypothetical protein [Bryobacterales bacterium]